MNSITWHDRARKQLKRIPRTYQEAILEAVDRLADFPRCQNLDVKALKNHPCGFRLRVGRYRVLFDHEAEIRIVYIQEVSKRDEQTY